MKPKGNPRARHRAAKTARTNGAKGGRPRARLPQELLDELGPPPVDKPLELSRWTSRLLGHAFWLRLRGELGAELEQSIRHFCRSIGLAQPVDVIIELTRRLRADADERAADERGPQPEKVSDAVPKHEALRAPR